MHFNNLWFLGPVNLKTNIGITAHENRKKWVNMYIFVTLVSLLAFANLIRARAPQTESCYHHQCSVVADLLYIYNFQGLHVNKTCGFSSRCSAEWMNEWVSGWMDVLWLHFNSQPNAIVDIYFTRICLHIHTRWVCVYWVVGMFIVYIECGFDLWAANIHTLDEIQPKTNSKYTSTASRLN